MPKRTLEEFIADNGGVESTIEYLGKSEMYNTKDHPQHAEAVDVMRRLYQREEERERLEDSAAEQAAADSEGLDLRQAVLEHPEEWAQLRSNAVADEPDTDTDTTEDDNG